MSWLLPIADMPPESAELTSGRLYFVLHDVEEPAIRPMLYTMLSADDHKALWVMRGEDVEEMDTLAQGGARLRLFLWQASKHQCMASSLMEELDHFGISLNTAIVLEEADRLLAGLTATDCDEALRVCRRWTEQRQCALILLFPRRIDASQIVSALTRNADCAAGFAHFRRGDGGLWWDIFHWLSGGRAISAQSLPLIESGNGLFALRSTITRRKKRKHAPDETLVIAELGITADSRRLPASWRGVEHADALVATAREMIAATVVFAFKADTSFDTLARAVFVLRRKCGPGLKIVVREVDSRLRHSREQLLLQLGANLIVPVEVSFSRLLGLVEMVQGQLFPRTLEADYESAVVGVAPAPEVGYLKPIDFARMAIGALEKTRTLGIESTLVRLPLVSGLTPIDALRCCDMKRLGDLCSADDNNLFLFLFACRDGDVPATLARLFRLPVDDLFEGEVRYFSANVMRTEIAALARRAVRDALPDLGEALREIPAMGGHDTQCSPMNDDLAGTPRHPLPIPAKQHPLKLRSDPALKGIRR